MRRTWIAMVACAALALACGRTGPYRTADGGIAGFGGGSGAGGSGAGGSNAGGGGDVPMGCRLDKLGFAPGDVCANDGFWEFCATDDAATQRRLLTDVRGAVPASFGALRCNPGEKVWLLTALDCFGVDDTAALATICALAADPAVRTIAQGRLQ
jgi:hypothetical protein